MFLVFLYLSKDLSDLSCDSPVNFDQIMMSTVMNYIEHGYQTATLTELADIMNQSASALSRQIKVVSGSTFKELLQTKRFQRAVALLKETNLAVSDIALAVGYENSSYFYRRFREIYGISPKVYRENDR
jgi:AraC-like DNA-binding protein